MPSPLELSPVLPTLSPAPWAPGQLESSAFKGEKEGASSYWLRASLLAPAKPVLGPAPLNRTHTLVLAEIYIATWSHSMAYTSCPSKMARKENPTGGTGAGTGGGGRRTHVIGLRCLKGPGSDGDAGKAEGKGASPPTLHPVSLLSLAALSHHSGSCWRRARAGWDSRAGGGWGDLL